MSEELIRCSDDHVIYNVVTEIMNKSYDDYNDESENYKTYRKEAKQIYYSILEYNLDYLPTGICEKNPGLSQIEIVNKLLSKYIKIEKEEEIKKIAYLNSKENQDESPYGDCNVWGAKNKYFIRNPQYLFSEYKTSDWKNNTYYYVYVYKGVKYVRFISTCFVDSDYDFAKKDWKKEICCKEIKELHKFGIDRNIWKLFTDENVDKWSVFEDPYEALEYANNFLCLRAKKMWIYDLTEDTACGYYYDQY